MKNNLSKDRFLCKCFLEFKFVASKKFFAYFLACLTLNSMCVCEVNVRACVHFNFGKISRNFDKRILCNFKILEA